MAWLLLAHGKKIELQHGVQRNKGMTRGTSQTRFIKGSPAVKKRRGHLHSDNYRKAFKGGVI
jgi:hypothetical protein